MDARERRRAIMGVLERAKDPVSGSALAREVGVSRQVVVQDIALLRADGHDIVATNRGYVLQDCLLYTSPSPRDRQKSRMPSSA